MRPEYTNRRQPYTYRRPPEQKILIWTTLIASFILITLLILGIYYVVDPFFRLPTEPPTPPTGAPQPPGPTVPPIIYQIYYATRFGHGPIFFFFIFVILIFLNETSYIALAFLHRHFSRGRMRIISEWKHIPLVTIIIPARNEEKVIEGTILTILETDYPRKEIIVVNDGSTDRTEGVVRRYMKYGVRLINQPNAGKAVALNNGILYAKGEIIVVFDADTIVDTDAITKLANHFKDPDVVSVSGNVKVGNRINLLTHMQALEYVREINTRRRAFDLLNTIYVVPGAIGAFRKSSFSSMGMYDTDTVTEDMDVTIKLVKRGIVLYDGDAVSHTEAPEDLKGWSRQRSRWYGGTMQTIWKHRIAWWHYGTLSYVGFPFLMLSMFFTPVMELTALLVGVVYALLGLWAGIFLIFGFLAVLEFTSTIISIFIDEEDYKLIFYVPAYVLVYRYMLDIVRMKVFWDVLTGRTKWSRTGRYGDLQKKVRSSDRYGQLGKLKVR